MVFFDPEKQFKFIDRLRNLVDFYFIIPGASDIVQLCDNLVSLPHHSEFYHPDLIAAADIVVGKVGYSTIAEVYYAGIPFIFLERPGFRESPALAKYVESEMPNLKISETEFHSGAWLNKLPEFSDVSRIKREATTGADQIARFICKSQNQIQSL